MTQTLDRPVRQPGPNHPLVLDDTSITVRVYAADTLLADRADAREVREADYPAVLYVDRNDIDMSKLTPSDRTSWCPYKGEATYFHVQRDDGTRLDNAVWTYETPFEHILGIQGRLGFYTNQVTVEPIV